MGGRSNGQFVGLLGGRTNGQFPHFLCNLHSGLWEYWSLSARVMHKLVTSLFQGDSREINNQMQPTSSIMLEYMERTLIDTERTCKRHTEMPEAQESNPQPPWCEVTLLTTVLLFHHHNVQSYLKIPYTSLCIPCVQFSQVLNSNLMCSCPLTFIFLKHLQLLKKLLSFKQKGLRVNIGYIKGRKLAVQRTLSFVPSKGANTSTFFPAQTLNPFSSILCESPLTLRDNLVYFKRKTKGQSRRISID